MKVLMFGWEFPPHNSGGLGVACEGLAKALAKQGIEISFVLPKKTNCESSFCNIIFANIPVNLKIRTVDSLLSPYATAKTYWHSVKNSVETGKQQNIYSPDLFGEVERYGEEAKKIAAAEEFDLIHAHDWLSFPAGLKAKEISGKPLITHIHATEFDRTGNNNVNQRVYGIEKEGFSKADTIIAVSNFTKNMVVRHYGINPDKIRVVHNAVNFSDFSGDIFDKIKNNKIKEGGEKIVLFLGRLTLQKGPDYFLKAAKKVLGRNPNVLFIITGSGDMEFQIIEEAAELGIADKVIFTGFLREAERTKIYQMADMYVLPSVSEPFGITPLESMVNETPILISNQSGVSEVISHCLKVDFWDTDEMANKILTVLEYPELHQCLKENAAKEVKKINWQDSAIECANIYNEILSS